jgi:hypothetical protein
MELHDVEPAAVPAPGPLVVSGDNPRYLSVAGDGRVVYLTGAHFNSNLQDGLGLGRDCPDEPERFDFEAYLEFLVAHGHNFIRLWRWEQFDGYLPGADVHFCMTPQPWPRHRSRHGHRRQAAVRPHAVRSGPLRAAPRTRCGRRRGRALLR